MVLRDSYEIFKVCGQFHANPRLNLVGFAQGVPKLWDLTSGYVLPEIFTTPSGKIIRRVRKRLRGTNGPSQITMLNMGWLELPPGTKSSMFFVLLYITLCFWTVEFVNATSPLKRLNFVSAPLGGATTKCRILKYGHIWVFASRRRHDKPMPEIFGVQEYTTAGLLFHVKFGPV